MFCFWHKWELKKSYVCKTNGYDFWGNIRTGISSELNFYKCSKCGELKAVLTDGIDEDEVNAGFYARKVISKFGSDLFLNEVAKL